MRRTSMVLSIVLLAALGAQLSAAGLPEAPEYAHPLSSGDREARESGASAQQEAVASGEGVLSNAGFAALEDRITQALSHRWSSSGSADFEAFVVQVVETEGGRRLPPVSDDVDQLYLKDGQRICGNLISGDVVFRTSFGTVRLPMDEIDVRILGNEAHYIELKNGDRLVGTIEGAVYEIVSPALGSLTVPTEDVRFVVQAQDESLGASP
jgi:hypothetical protein